MPTVVVASSERVVLAWLGSLPGLSPAMVASILPADASAWSSAGFVTATVAGGRPGIEVPTRAPLIQIDTWATKPGSQRPPWGQANTLAEVVVKGCLGSAVGRSVDLSLSVGNPVSTGTARILSAWLVSEPMRVYSDDSSYARYRMDIRMDWVAT